VGLQGQQDPKVCQEQQVPQDQLERQGHEVFRECRGCKVSKGLREQQGHKVQQDLLAQVSRRI
jgi:hypothetical protein